jgi:5-methylcytosine-specific restriction enzyme subunit McrC
VESFAQIYNIDSEAPAIHAPSLKGVLSPLIVLHFLGVVNRLKSLKKGYVHYSENLKKIKGHIKVMKNERMNIASKRYDRVFCEYDEYTVDIPENRIIKKDQVGIKNCQENCQQEYKVYYFYSSVSFLLFSKWSRK